MTIYLFLLSLWVGLSCEFLHSIYTWALEAKLGANVHLFGDSCFAPACLAEIVAAELLGQVELQLANSD